MSISKGDLMKRSSRRAFLETAGKAGLATAILGGAFAGRGRAARLGMNVLFLSIDDLRPQLG